MFINDMPRFVGESYLLGDGFETIGHFLIDPVHVFFLLLWFEVRPGFSTRDITV